MITVYGIPNCDTVRRARKWLDEAGIEHRFHDFRADGIDAGTLAGWADELGWEILLNSRGRTWRGLPEDIKSSVDAASAPALMATHPALIKRPVFDLGDRRLVGFAPATLEELKAL